MVVYTGDATLTKLPATISTDNNLMMQIVEQTASLKRLCFFLFAVRFCLRL